MRETLGHPETALVRTSRSPWVPSAERPLGARQVCISNQMARPGFSRPEPDLYRAGDRDAPANYPLGGRVEARACFCTACKLMAASTLLRDPNAMFSKRTLLPSM